MKNRIIEIAKKNMADIVGFAPASRFDKDDTIFKIFPNTKTVIALGFRILRGSCRGIEEGSTYYQYTTMGVQNLEQIVMPMALIKISNFIEEEGFIAVPQKKHQLIMAEEDSTDPEVAYNEIFRGKTQENQINFLNAAVKCGLGEKGLHGALLTDEFGPLLRYCVILTNAEIEATDEYVPHLCDKCGKCIEGCPGKAIDRNGKVDLWQCSVYYNGANGSRNPFMPANALEEIGNRLDIIAGEAKVTPQTAKEILDGLYFYPPISHNYRSSICGRACDMECYIHLEEKGVLKKKFNTQFRKREKWKLDTEIYK